MKIEPRYYIRNGLKLLMQNRRRLLVPAVLSSVASLLLSVDGWLPQNMLPVGIISNIGYALLIFGVMYLSLLAYTGVLLVAKECLDSENSSLIESYKESTKYIWPIAGYTILVIIFAIFVGVIFMVLYSIVPYHFAKQFIIMTGLLIILMVVSLFDLVMISVVIDFQSKKRLRRCIGLIKNNFVPVMLILFISSSIVMIPTFFILSLSLDLSRSAVIIKDILIAVLEVFFVPFAAFVQIPLYRDLSQEKYQIGENYEN